MIVDSHCHLDFPDFADELDQVVARARLNGVERMLTIGTKYHKFKGVRAIAERFDNVWCTVGVHPHEAEAESADVDADRLIAETAHEKVVGVGETGLDYFYDHSPRDLQQGLFRAHIRAAQETGLPLVVHTRNADEDTARILEEEMNRAPYTGLLHCFSSSQWLADRALDLGLSLSFSGIATFKKADGVRAAARAAPDDRILVETDAPYLAPVPYRGKRNEPAFVRETLKALAAERGVSDDIFARQTTQNFHSLFKKIEAPHGF